MLRSKRIPFHSPLEKRDVLRAVCLGRDAVPFQELPFEVLIVAISALLCDFRNAKICALQKHGSILHAALDEILCKGDAKKLFIKLLESGAAHADFVGGVVYRA